MPTLKNVPFSAFPDFFVKITHNVLQLKAGGLSKLQPSIPTKGFIKIQKFLFRRPPAGF